MNTINVIWTLIHRSLGILPSVNSKLWYRQLSAWPEKIWLILALMHKAHFIILKHKTAFYMYQKTVPSLVKIHWRMLILECSQGYYAVKMWPSDLDLWPWKSIGFQILLRTKYVPSLVKIHGRMLILECSQGCYGRKDGRTDGSVTI
jgi:hypothetical protein